MIGKLLKKQKLNNKEKPDFQPYIYKAKVVRVIDGDTYILDVDLGFNIRYTIRGRLMGVNTPELNTQAGKVAKGTVQILLGGKEFFIKTEKDRKGKYGRYLVDIWLDNANCWLSEYILKKKLGVKYGK